MYPGTLSLACARGCRRPIRCPRAQPRRCLSCVPPPSTFPLPLRLPRGAHTCAFCPAETNRQPFPRKRPTGLHGQAYHDASQSTEKNHPPLRSAHAHTHSPFLPAVEPGQHAQTPHERTSPTPSPTPIRITGTSPTGCAMDTHAQAFRVTTPLARSLLRSRPWSLPRL